jgi:nitrogen regulatory protein P-II 1
MKKIEAVIQPFKLEAVMDALIEAGVEGMTVSEVRGHGRSKGHQALFRGVEYDTTLLPKIKVEIVTPDSEVEQLLRVITAAARTGHMGDGKLFVYDVAEAIRIRTGEINEAAV